MSLGSQSLSLGLPGCKSLNITPAPSFPDRGCFSYVASGCDLDTLSMLASVFFHHLLVLSLVDLFGTLIISLRHLLTHDLSKSVVASLWVEPLLALGLLFLLCGLLLASLRLNSLNVRLEEDTLGARLPVSFVQLRIFEAIRALKLSSCIVDSDLVINLDSFV